MGSEEDEHRALVSAIDSIEECVKEAARHDTADIAKIVSECAALASDPSDSGTEVQDHPGSH